MTEGKLNLQAYLDAANCLVNHDEIFRAIHLLDNLPGEYRDYPPKEVISLKREILQRVTSSDFLVHSAPGFKVDKNQAMETTLRGNLLLRDVSELNQKGVTPHIVDFGPGEYWAYFMLERLNCKFSYKAISITQTAKEAVREHVKQEDLGGPIIFVACEIIEHLFDEREILIEYMRQPRPAEIMHFSTPKYTFMVHENWRNQENMGHIRTYTPYEFGSVIAKMFPDYTAAFYDSKVMHLRLSRKTE